MSTLIDHAEDDDDLPVAVPVEHAPAAPRSPSSLGRRIRWGLIGAMAIAVAVLLVRGRGVGQWMKQTLGISGQSLAPPLVIGARPSDGAANVKPDEALSFRMSAPNGALAAATLNSSNIVLRKADDETPIEAAISQSTGSDGITTVTLRPARTLDGMTRYKLSIGAGLKDAKGVAAVARTISFSTGSLADPSIKFAQVSLPTAGGAGFTCVQMGPDGRLWAGSDEGRIYRFPITADGTLGKPEVFTALQETNGGNRLLTGFAFDPSTSSSADPSNGTVTIWVSHGWFGFESAPDLSGKVSRMGGKGLADVHDVVVGLPRSVKDHLTNQPAFGPDGALYIPQPSNSAYGAPDEIWGNRPEHRLNASILRLDTKSLGQSQTIDARTADVGGSYDPDAPAAPLTIYAKGIRLAYDLLWHSNGRLYAAVNGSSPGGNTPAGAKAPSLKAVTMTEHDWLFDVRKGRYYGHPNPAQGHYILNGGNPTAGSDVAEVTEYPVGTQPDADWTPAAYDFGTHVSPNGTVEFKSGAFDGKMKGKVLVCRYNNGSDILCLDLDEKGQVRTAHVGIPGLTKLASPLDIAEDPSTGCLYVSEYGAQKITLLRPVK
ncbi:Ig-like domain-containing protein [Humisphaera borealis]|uniref:Ig-like domain-containing protein n=1 Tax=Humisphaera borealis TaxID=2807512 RepID=A0A7M2X018_9BACT|nr:Ig-like domain-containing protein [Humisphaera borealis]QOV91029.1 Ig-like domain-containing protein [Humisphaera borealis]